MTRKSRTAFFFTIFLLLFACAAPNMARAASTYQDPCPSDGSASALDQQLTKDFSVTGSNLIQAQLAAQTLFASIDVKLQACWQNIQNVFTTLGAHGDPLALIYSVIGQVVLNAINQACSIALNDLNQIKNYALSQLNRLCLPMPDFGLGGNSLNLKDVTCNGTALLQPGSSINGQDPINFDMRSLFPQSSSTPSQ